MNQHMRCAVYTRKSSTEGLEQDFNSLDAQREACEAFVQSQKGLGWQVIRKHYDDGGLSGGSMDRPALQELLADIGKGKINLVVVYKVDRLTRSLTDFSKIIDIFDTGNISFVSVTQQFNTSSSMGRLTLNVLLSFAQFEREVTAERIRDKIAASRKKGMWMGGLSPLGYDAIDKKLIVNEVEAKTVRGLYALYREYQSVRKLKLAADRLGYLTKRRGSGNQITGGKPFTRGHLYQLLHNPVYVGEVAHRGNTYPGQHEAIIDRETWQAVRSLLHARAPVRYYQGNVRLRCLLTGLVSDENGGRLSPSYCQKKGRRYRYYLSGQVPQGDNKTKRWRLPADELEEAVLYELARFLSDALKIADTLGETESPIAVQPAVQAAATLATAIIEGPADETIETVRSLLEQVVVEPAQLRITLSGTGLVTYLGMNHTGVSHTSDGNPIILTAPMSVRRRGVAQKIILHSNTEATFHDDRLIRLVRDAHQWLMKITSGQVRSVRQIAHEANRDEGDVSRSLPLAFLAPDIMEAILKGKQPVELTAEKLRRLRRLPPSWEEQRTLLGFHT